jgi:hypothetical protein
VKQRNAARRELRDYKRRVELSLDLRRMADLFADEYLVVAQISPGTAANSQVRHQLEQRIKDSFEWFERQADRSASMMEEKGLPDEAARHRVRRGIDGQLLLPAALDKGPLASRLDLVNGLNRYRDSLTRVASDQLRDL